MIAAFMQEMNVQYATYKTFLCIIIIIITSNKKHFMKNVKECRDVIVKKVLEQGWDTRTTHYTHVGPMTLHHCHQLHDLYCLFV